MRTSLAVLLILALLPSLFGEERWIRIQSPNFEIYSSAGERSTRETLKYFEEIRSFFLQAFKARETPADAPARINLLAFGSRKEFALYRPTDFAAAFYLATSQKDYIVLSETGSETFSTAVHEYVHLWVNHQDLHFPPWLNEGLAELFSTLKPTGKQIAVGGVIQSRLQSIQQDKWVPLAGIVSADENSPYYHETSKAGALYNEGWALTHMLALSTQYGAGPLGMQFKELLAVISAGTPSAEALYRVYGKSVGQIENDLRAYVRGGQFKTPLFPLQLVQPTETLTAEAASNVDIGLALADLKLQPGNETEIRKTVEQLSAEAPDRPEPYATLGYLSWRAGHNDEAVQDFAKAYSLGDRNPKMLWDFGRLSERPDAKQAADILTELLRQFPQRLDVRLELAETQVRMNQSRDALATVNPVRSVDKQNAFRLFKIIAFAQLQSGNREEATVAADRMRKEAVTDSDRAEADRIQRMLANGGPGGRASAVSRAPAVASDDGAPTLRRQSARDLSPTAADPPQGPVRPSIEGSFVALDCMGEEANFVVRTTTGQTRKFQATDPSQIVVEGRGTINLNCGPQKTAPQVRIEYDPSPDAGVDGIVRSIRFETATAGQ